MGVKEDIALFDTVFSDYDTVSDWAKESVRKMDSLGIMRGVGDNNFHQNQITQWNSQR